MLLSPLAKSTKSEYTYQLGRFIKEMTGEFVTTHSLCDYIEAGFIQAQTTAESNAHVVKVVSV